jgi:RNA polymerase sigma-70 factor (ECF subfamily)
MGEHGVGTSDWELVQQTRAGDRDAFRELVERYQRKIASLALGMLRNREDALDIVQETFAKAYQNLERFKGDAAFYTWVYRIAVNLCVDHQRRGAKQPLAPFEVDDRGEGPAPGLPDGPRPDQPFDRARDAEIARRVHEAVRELTPEHRAVILLREVEGLSYSEISQVLDCPKGTVMSRLHYARRQLQGHLRGLL